MSRRILLTLSAERYPENRILSLFKTVLKDKSIQKKKCNGQTCYEYSLNKSKICIDPYEELNDDFLKLTLAGFFSESIIESHFIAIISCLLIALVFIVFSNGTISFEGSRFIRHGKLLSIFIAGITFSALFVNFLQHNFISKSFCMMNPTEGSD